MITLPRSVSNAEEAIRLAPAIGFMEYGQGSYLSNIDDTGDEIKLFLGIKYPLLIEDEERSIPSMRIIPDVTSINFKRNDTGRFGYDFDQYSVFKEKLIQKDYLFLQTLERELIRNTYESLSKIPSVANTLTPLMEISNSFRFQEKLDKNKVLKSRKNQRQMHNYIRFMVRNDLISVSENDIHPTGKLLGFIDSKDGNFSIRLMGDLLMRNYSELMTFLHLSGLKPYLTIANSYYTPSSEAGSLLRVGIERLRDYYKRLYRTSPILMKLRNQVSMLSEVEVLRIENRSITGIEEILSRQMGVLETMQSS